MKNLMRSLLIGVALASGVSLLFGCKDEPKQKAEAQGNVQQQVGKEAAQAVQAPVTEARKAAEAVQTKTTGQEKKKLEGC